MPHTPTRSLSTIDRRNFLQLLGAGAATLGVASAHAATASTPPPPAAKSATVKLTVLYGQPVDATVFESYYAETHMPLAKKISGFTRLELSKVMPGPDGAKPAFYRMAEFWFESAAAMQACMASPEAKAAADDLKNFSTGGVTFFASEIMG